MLSQDDGRRIWLCTRPTDMRRSFNGLSALVRNDLGGDPTCGHWCVFIDKRRTILKILAFDGDGCWIWSKRLEAGRFTTCGLEQPSSGKQSALAPDCRRRSVYEEGHC